jgi:hypothetical protein
MPYVIASVCPVPPLADGIPREPTVRSRDVGRPDQEAERGRGLVLVEALTDAWGRDGTCIWCTFAPATEESDETA